MRNIEKEFRNDSVEFHFKQYQFYAPQCLKDQIQSRVEELLPILKTTTFKSKEFYYNIADKSSLNIKNLAQRNRCYCDLKLKTKLKSYRIPKANETISTTSKSIIEQSDLFCSSPLVCCQTKLANGSIEVLIGDIALQKVNSNIFQMISMF